MKKEKSKVIRLTGEEERQLEAIAEREGCSVSALLLDSALSKPQTPDVPLRQVLVRELSKLTRLMEKTDDIYIRQEVEAWEDAIWLSLKL